MEKIIKKWGDSLIVNFSVDDRKLHNLVEGKKIVFTITAVEDFKHVQ